MTSAAYSSHPVLAVATDAVLPVLGVLTILLPTLAWRGGRLKRPELLWVCGLVSIALLYILRYVSHHTSVWLTTFGAHFSAHTAVAVSFGVTLIAFRLKLLPAVVAAVAGYMWAITYLPYHTLPDVLSTAAVILPLSVICHLPWWRRKN